MVEDLDANDLVLDGELGCVLFDNPRIGLAPSLYWWVTFRYLDIHRDWGDTSCQLDVEWIVLGPTDWRAMSPAVVRYPTFANPAEASLYYFAHHRFDSITLEVGEQRVSASSVGVDSPVTSTGSVCRRCGPRGGWTSRRWSSPSATAHRPSRPPVRCWTRSRAPRVWRASSIGATTASRPPRTPVP